MTAENPPAVHPSSVSPEPRSPAESVVHPPSDPPVSEAPLPLGVGERGSGDTGTTEEERQPLPSAGAPNTGRKDLPMPSNTLLTELDRAVDDAIVNLLVVCQDERL